MIARRSKRDERTSRLIGARPITPRRRDIRAVSRGQRARDVVIRDVGHRRDVPYTRLSSDDRVWTVLSAWGDGLRRARHAMAMTQESLEHRSGVDQTQISRFERGLAPRMPAERLAVIGTVLGKWFPLGTCPHEHDCPWRTSTASADPNMTLERFREWRSKTSDSMRDLPLKDEREDPDPNPFTLPPGLL
jgi:hypothetical protein